jgi:hypothetical protein
MISIKQTSGLLAAGLLFASCAPFPPGNGRQAPIDPNRVPVAPRVEDANARAEADRKAAAERKRLRDQKRRTDAANAAKARDMDNDPPTVKPDKPAPPKIDKPTPPKTTYRTAKEIVGKPGYVYNPWTNKAVDIRGIPSGELVVDPQDPNPNHKFRVP